MKEKLFSVTLKDCKVDFYRGSGKGGQKRNKTSSACRITHTASGAIGECENNRSQEQNKKEAFLRMSKTVKFQSWMNLEVLRVSGEIRKIEAQIERDINDPSKTKIEIIDNGKWVEPKRKEVKRKPSEVDQKKKDRTESKKLCKDY